MFHRLNAQPKLAKYSNPRAATNRKDAKNKNLVPWRPGLEITLCNSRNIYSDGTPWKWSGDGEMEWRETSPRGYIRTSDNMVFRTPNPRLLWTGWERGAGGGVQAQGLCVHEDDVYPRSYKKRGVSGFVTAKLDSVGVLWKRGELDSLSWAGEQIEAGFRNPPTKESLGLLGWNMLPDGSAVDTITPLGEGHLRGSILLPGHDPNLWDGLSDVVVQSSGKEGCTLAAGTVTDPVKAGRYFPALRKLPVGCRFEVESRWYWYRFSAFRKAGCLVFGAEHLPPLKKETQKITLLRRYDRGARWCFLFSPEDIDFQSPFRPVIGSYCKGSDEERCLVVHRPDRLRYASAVKRSHVVETGANKSYKVFSQFPLGKITGTQKMFGENSVRRMPQSQPKRRQRLVELYGDLVPDDYYNYRDEEIKKMAEDFKIATKEGYCEWAEAVNKSVVPSDVFRKLAAEGLVQTRIPCGQMKCYQPIRFQDIESNPKIAHVIVGHAKETGQGWLVHLLCQFPARFKSAVLAHSFS